MVHKQIWSLTSDGSTGQIQGSQIEVGNAEINLTIPIPAASVNYPLTVSWTYENMQSMGLKADKNMTVDFMAGTHPVLTIVLVANSPYIWSKSNNYWPCGFTCDPAWLEVSCEGAATLQLMVLLNI